jgi:hypothetical protein
MVIKTSRQKSEKVLDAVFALGSLVSPKHRVDVDYKILAENLLVRAAANVASQEDISEVTLLDFCFVLFMRLQLLDHGSGFILQFDCPDSPQLKGRTSIAFMVLEDGSLVLGFTNGPTHRATKRIYRYPQDDERYELVSRARLFEGSVSPWDD